MTFATVGEIGVSSVRLQDGCRHSPVRPTAGLWRLPPAPARPVTLRGMDPRTGLPVVGMVGGGQLARMTHQAAIALGQSLRVLAAAPDDGAALVAAELQHGHHADLAALREFAKGCDVVTFDHEHVPTEHLRTLAAEGVTVLPGPDALVHAQDKRVMRERLAALGAPAPRWAPVESAEDLERFGAEVGWPVIIKATRGGYDGKGVWSVGGPAEGAELLASGTPLIAEE